MNRRLLILLVLPFILSCGTTRSWTSNEEPRTYIEHIPRNLASGSPLMIVLHGYTNSPSLIQFYSGMNMMANKYGFGVIYPRGSEDRFGNTHWNADLRISETDDVAFLTALRDQKVEEYGFDPNRIFVFGVSNGGFMAYTLACRVPEKFTAVASIIGTMSGETWSRRDETAAPMPVLQLSGMKDRVVPADGTMSSDYGWGGAPPVPEIMEYWARKNRTEPMKTLTLNRNVTAHIASNPVTKNNVWYYEIRNLDHDWPNALENGINATHLIWDFFSTVTKPN